MITPNPVGLYFIKRIDVNATDGDLSLIGLFQNRSFSTFPSAPAEMTVFTMLHGGRGEGILQLGVYLLNEMEEYNTKSDWIYRQRKWIRFPNEPDFLVTIELKLRKLCFLNAGEYLFVLTFDGNLVTERRMSIRTGEPHHE